MYGGQRQASRHRLRQRHSVAPKEPPEKLLAPARVYLHQKAIDEIVLQGCKRKLLKAIAEAAKGDKGVGGR